MTSISRVSSFLLLSLIIQHLSAAPIELSTPAISKQNWSKEAIAEKCGNFPKSLCDLDSVLTTSQYANLMDLLKKNLGRDDGCERKIHVVVIENLDFPQSQAVNKAMEETAEYLRNQWRGDCCTSVVTLLSTGDARVWTRFCDNSGLCEDIVTSTYQNNRHYLFDQKEYSRGLEEIIKAYQYEIINEESCKTSTAIFIVVGVIYAIVAAGYFCCAICCGGEGGGGSGGYSGGGGGGGGCDGGGGGGGGGCDGGGGGGD